jgi:hypothetical protein
MYTINGRQRQVGRGDNRPLGYYGVAGLASTIIGPDGVPVTITDPGNDSVNLDFSQGYSVAPGAPGSSTNPTPSYGAGTPLTVSTPSPNLTSSSNGTLLAMVIGATALVFLASGRR